MLQSFANDATEHVFDGETSKKARQLLPTQLWRIAHRKLAQLDAAVKIDDLRAPPGNRLELLKGDREGQHSVRIDDQYRICFTWAEEGPTAVEIVDYH